METAWVPINRLMEMWYIYKMEYYSAITKKEIMSFAGKWVEQKTIMLSKVSQAHKIKYGMFSLIFGILKKKKREK